MEEEIKAGETVVETTAPQGGDGSAAIQTETQGEQSPYASLAKRIGIEGSDEDAIAGHFGKFQGELESERKARVELEGRIKGLSPMLLTIHEKLAEKGFAGSDDELLDFIGGEISQARTNYAGMAASNPMDVITKGIMLSNPLLTEAEAKMEAKMEARRIKEFVDGDNPDATDEEIEAAYSSMLTAKAKGYVPALEAKRPKFAVKPEGIMTPDQQKKAMEEAQAKATEAFDAAFNGFKKLDLGDGKAWDVKLVDQNGQVIPEMVPVLKAASDPGSILLNQDGSINYAKALEVMFVYHNYKDMISAKAKEAAGLSAKGVQNQLANVNGSGAHTPAQNNQPQEAWFRPKV